MVCSLWRVTKTEARDSLLEDRDAKAICRLRSSEAMVMATMLCREILIVVKARTAFNQRVAGQR